MFSRLLVKNVNAKYSHNKKKLKNTKKPTLVKEKKKKKKKGRKKKTKRKKKKEMNTPTPSPRFTDTRLDLRPE